MIIRELEAGEFEKLRSHPLLVESGVPAPETSHIIVAEDNGEIVGFWMVLLVPHLEPAWIAPKYRGSMLVWRLWKSVKRLLDALYPNGAISCSSTPEIGGYLERLGLQKLPYDTYLYTTQPTVKSQFPGVQS